MPLIFPERLLFVRAPNEGLWTSSIWVGKKTASVSSFSCLSFARGVVFLIFCGFLVCRLVTPLYPLVNRRILRRLAREGSDENFEVKRCVSTVLVLLGNKLQLSLLIRPYFLYALKRSWTQLLVDRTFLSFLRVLAPCSRWAFGFGFTCVARVHWTAFNKQRFVICPSETVSCLSWSVL